MSKFLSLSLSRILKNMNGFRSLAGMQQKQTVHQNSIPEPKTTSTQLRMLRSQDSLLTRKEKVPLDSPP